MYFDPVSSWLVALIVDGIVISGEKSKRGTVEEYYQNRIKHENEMLNSNIRRVKEKYGVTLAEMAYEKIQSYVRITKDSFPFRCKNGQIIIDIDNQEYIIAVLEECAKQYSKYDTLETYRQKAEWYKNAADEARRQKELYAKELEELRIKEAREREKQESMGKIVVLVGNVVCLHVLLHPFQRIGRKCHIRVEPHHVVRSGLDGLECEIFTALSNQ